MKKTKLLFYTLLGLLAFNFLSCRKEDPVPADIADYRSGVLILNEGTFGWGTASVGQYDPDKGNYREKIFANANGGLPLGDVAFSLARNQGRNFIIVNNSGKIEVVDPADFRRKGTITGVPSPRYLLAPKNGKGYVTNYCVGCPSEISVVDMAGLSVIRRIPTTGAVEEMIKVGEEIFITQVGNNQVLILDLAQEQITDSILVGYQPGGIRQDINGKLWVLCSGGGGWDPQNENAKLICINPQSKQIELQLTFSDINDYPSNLTISNDGQFLYYLIAGEGVFRISVQATSLPITPVIPAGEKNFYAFGVSGDDQEIYVSDAVDYVQRGMIYRYSAVDYSLIASFRAGIIPGAFVFQ